MCKSCLDGWIIHCWEFYTTETWKASMYSHCLLYLDWFFKKIFNTDFKGYFPSTVQFSQFSHSVVSGSLQPHGLQHARPPCPSPVPGVHPNPCPLSWWCHPTISSSVVPFCSCPQSFAASGSFLMSQLFTSGGQSFGALASASVLPMNIQDWFPLGLTGLISLLSKGLSRAFTSPTIWKQ